MKKCITLLCAMCMFAMTGCSGIETPVTELMAGYIVIEGDILYVDRVEIVTERDSERIEELGLELGDMPSGYFIYNKDEEKDVYELTNETLYMFVDVNLLFYKGKNEEKIYSTTEKEKFIEHLRVSYFDFPPAQNVPFFIIVEDGKVVSVTEEFRFTI